MAIKNDREYRMIQLPDMQFRVAENEGEEPRYIVEGYATTYDDPYTLYSFDGVDYKEQIARDALVGADMSDVVFLFNHEGMVFARKSKGTLELSSDDKGLHVRADLGTTQDARNMYENIASGNVSQMSWAFTIDADEYDEKTHTRSILAIRKVYDVSAVTFPANPSTDISARSYFDGVIEEERRRERERAEKLERLNKLLKGESYGN